MKFILMTISVLSIISGHPHIFRKPRNHLKILTLNEQSLVAAEQHLVGRDSSVDISTRFGLDGPGSESRGGIDFPHPSIPAQGTVDPSIQWVPGLSRG
jgi:hypothetical protein